ncbi:hypothetical protein T01_11021 [Trichinella spiralis]|uniref:Uncharacterized protein n=1 Tax=Trichinella spiralis TaxID=6334 RepID=A0A0V0YPT6_TRISP|nr:hypothetical protein T01_11021 [Trichinella spiralis]
MAVSATPDCPVVEKMETRHCMDQMADRKDH